MYTIMQEPTRGPKQVIVKTMTVNKGTDIVHNFFENMKYMKQAVRNKTILSNEA